jgi:hypothetical protein
MEYRLYTLNKRSQILGSAYIIQAQTDEDAIAKARRLQSSLDIELWQDARIVIKLRPVRYPVRTFGDMDCCIAMILHPASFG